jgi:hypothetical protein
LSGLGQAHEQRRGLPPGFGARQGRDAPQAADDIQLAHDVRVEDRPAAVQ